ncbi:site-specific DNA-methyltransferase [Pseudomonas sp. HN8-3]|uniref:site-specific DNA-methyltransferase n=1 Tax=Pseudomonas sp. HN8-3 TaxID=2886361 RepID=UPI001E3C10EF|nr:site-specific DNA-methyltransferase [Pseudomonas sp. HN8-3]UEH07728.1 site-specific DNA-methyltransferase [Pseudomonas sp. HN8-3]
MAGKTKLELTWIGKDERPRLEPRILIEDPVFSYHAETRREGDHFDNRLIQGDNLLALKALETDPDVRGKVKCIFIDPPYNTGSAFEHYDDGVEHSLWLGMMRDRVSILRELLAENGSLWITLDDNEAHYFKVMCDELFGRRNFVANIIWQKKYSKQNDAKQFSTSHDHVLVYAKNKDSWRPNQVERTPEQLKGYNNHDNDPRGLWTSVVYTCSKNSKERPNLYYPLIHPATGKEVWPNENRVWAYEKETHQKHVEGNMLWWGKKGEQEKPRIKVFLSKVGTGVVPDTIWLRDVVGDNQDAKREAIQLSGNDAFSTPKPEALLMRILGIATKPGDLVLDSFAGSGTTGAVAHKMGRRWIMVELGNHAKTHIVPRMQKVIDSVDKGGVTEAAAWKGGGGYRFFKLAPSLLQKDKWGNLVINKDYQPEMLAEAICKHFNYTYAPSAEHYWMHGKATENAFIYVTTNSLTFDQLNALSDEVGEERSLLVCCMAYEAAGDNLTNLTIKKIPRVVLDRCEWGKDDYSLKIAALPLQDAELDAVEITAAKPKKNKSPVAQANLFDGTEEN